MTEGMGLYVSLGIVKVRRTNVGPRMSHLVRDGLLAPPMLNSITGRHTPQLSCDLLTDAAGGSSFPFLANFNNGEEMIQKIYRTIDI